MDVTLTVCITCNSAASNSASNSGPSGGLLLAEALERAAATRTDAPRIVRHECLWACAHSCAILMRSKGRTGYLAGRFEPSGAAAAAILDWAAAYGESPDGHVPYARWPEGMKGHFVARIPVFEEET
jgi:predicted metal-binding protein